jgi:glycosyltransferase involved in cell wall biosynthesis
VVATRVGGNAEVVPDGALGILVPPDSDVALREAILEAFRRRWDEAKMIAHARAHSWDAAARAVLEEFDRLVPVCRSGSPTVRAAEADR